MISLVVDLGYLSCHNCVSGFGAQQVVTQHSMYPKVSDVRAGSVAFVQRFDLCDVHHLSGHVMAISFVLELKYDHAVNCIHLDQGWKYVLQELSRHLWLNL